MFGVPGRTEFDLNFRLFGVPARITPFFWVATAFLGSNLRDGQAFVLWIVAVFVSILVHEFGHALTAVYFGERPEVVLYEFGGLCVHDAGRLRPRQEFLILTMGPGAGFLLVGAILLLGSVLTGVRPMSVWDLELPGVRSIGVLRFLSFLFQINVYWGLVNLLPVFPLDGGRMTMIVMSHLDRRHGMRRSFIVSLVCAGLVAVYMASVDQFMAALMFGFLAFRSYQYLQNLHYQAKYGDNFESEEDWWKR